MEKLKSIAKNNLLKVWVVVCVVVLSLGSSIYIAFADGGGGGGSTSGSSVGSNFYHTYVWYDKTNNGSDPVQGWGTQSIAYFWTLINDKMYSQHGIKLSNSVTEASQKTKFYNACQEALNNAIRRSNKPGTDKARIVAVSVFYSNTPNQPGRNAAIYAQYNLNTYKSFFPNPPTHDMIDGNVLDDTMWWEACNQTDAEPGETWAHYMWRIGGKDTCGGVNGYAPYSIIAIAVNESDFNSGNYVTLNKHVIGDASDEDATDAEKYFYEQTKNNRFYDLSGAQFTLYEEDGRTPMMAFKVKNAAGDVDSNEVKVVFTTDKNGSTETYKIPPGTYYLKETRAPNAGYLKDTDGDGISDKTDISTGKGKKIVIDTVNDKFTVDGSKMPVVGTYENERKIYGIDWYDEPEKATITVKKVIEGYNKSADSVEHIFYEMVKNNEFYSIAGAKFNLYKRSGDTRGALSKGLVYNANGTIGAFTNCIYTTDEDGLTETYQVAYNDYYLTETKNPKGFLQDTDGDKTPDKYDVDTNWSGRKITISPATTYPNQITETWENQPEKVTVKVNKHIVGEDAAQGSFDNLLYLATRDNPCYDLSNAKFTFYNYNGENQAAGSVSVGQAVTANGTPDASKGPNGRSNVVFTTDADGSTNSFKMVYGHYWMKETQAPNLGYWLDTDGDGVSDEYDADTNYKGKHVVVSPDTAVNETVTFHWWDEPLSDLHPIYLYKRDTFTGGLSSLPEGDGDLNGAEYRFAYYKGIYRTVETLPGYSADGMDWSKADTTAIWKSHSYTTAEGVVFTGQMDFGKDTPSTGTWKYVKNGGNVLPLGTLVIQEVTPPKGYLIDDRIYLYSVTDNGTHLRSQLKHTPWNKDGSDGTTADRDWNAFLNEYDLNGSQTGAETPWIKDDDQK